MAKTINELLGGTGTSPISTAFNVFKEYQTIMQSIEDRQYIREQRAIKKEKRMVDTVKEIGVGVQNAVNAGDFDAATSLKTQYDNVLKKMKPIEDEELTTSLQANFTATNDKFKNIEKFEEADEYFDKVLKVSDTGNEFHFESLKKLSREKDEEGNNIGAELLNKRLTDGIDKIQGYLKNVASDFGEKSFLYKKGLDAQKTLEYIQSIKGNDELIGTTIDNQMLNSYRAGRQMTPESVRNMFQTEINQNQNRKDRLVSSINTLAGKVISLQTATEEDFLSGAFEDLVDEEIIQDGQKIEQKRQAGIEHYYGEIAKLDKEVQELDTLIETYQGDYQYKDFRLETNQDTAIQFDTNNVKKLINKLDGLNGYKYKGTYAGKNIEELELPELLKMQTEMQSEYNAYIIEKNEKDRIAKEQAKIEELNQDNVDWLETMDLGNIPIDKIDAEALKRYRKRHLQTNKKFNDKDAKVELIQENVNKLKKARQLSSKYISNKPLSDDEANELARLLDSHVKSPGKYSSIFLKNYKRGKTGRTRTLNLFNQVIESGRGSDTLFGVLAQTDIRGENVEEFLENFSDYAKGIKEAREAEYLENKRKFLEDSKITL